MALLINSNSNFNPRSPHRERHICTNCSLDIFDISIHAPLTGSDPERTPILPFLRISIHAPLTGSDPVRPRQPLQHNKYFNPRSPHRERHLSRTDSSILWHFNPRSPHRERLGIMVRIETRLYFNPRSPHRERRFCFAGACVFAFISIHAPLTGSDFVQFFGRINLSQFQSTLPSQGATFVRI